MIAVNPGKNPCCAGFSQVPFTRRHLRSEEHTSELQSLAYLVCRLLLEKKKKIKYIQVVQELPNSRFNHPAYSARCSNPSVVDTFLSSSRFPPNTTSKYTTDSNVCNLPI